MKTLNISTVIRIIFSFIFFFICLFSYGQNTNYSKKNHRHDNDYAKQEHEHIEFSEIDRVNTSIKKLENEVDQNKKLSVENNQGIKELKDGIIKENQNFLNRFWIVIAAALVFLMQAGFTAFEVGLVQRKHRNGVGLKNITDWLVVCLVFYVFGFQLMFGESNGWFGTSLFALDGIEGVNDSYDYDFFIFQLAFACTAVTIISGALSERTKFVHYIIIALVVGGFIYPVFGHWVWGNTLVGDNRPLLAECGFMDFAGSSVVHLVGACVAMVGIFFVGPRYKRFSTTHQPAMPLRPANLGYSALGVFILWFGWWGFNGGSTLTYDDSVAKIILNTNLAGAAGGLTAFFFAWSVYIRKKKQLLRQSPNFEESNEKLEIRQEEMFMKAMGGILGGLVAITASANIMSPLSSIFIGFIAGIVHNLTFDLLIRWRLDDPVGAIPVHGFCGVLGVFLLVIGNPYQFSVNESAFQDFAQQVLEISQSSDNVSLTIGDLANYPSFEDKSHYGGLKPENLPDHIKVLTLDSVYHRFHDLNYLQTSTGDLISLSKDRINDYLSEDMNTFPFGIENFSKSDLPQSWKDQAIVQIMGILVAIAFAGGVSFILFLILKPLGLTTSRDAQLRGDIL